MNKPDYIAKNTIQIKLTWFVILLYYIILWKYSTWLFNKKEVYKYKTDLIGLLLYYNILYYNHNDLHETCKILVSWRALRSHDGASASGLSHIYKSHLVIWLSALMTDERYYHTHLRQDTGLTGFLLLKAFYSSGLCSL